MVRAASATDSSLLKQDTEQRCDSLFRHELFTKAYAPRQPTLLA